MLIGVELKRIGSETVIMNTMILISMLLSASLTMKVDTVPSSRVRRLNLVISLRVIIFQMTLLK